MLVSRQFMSWSYSSIERFVFSAEDMELATLPPPSPATTTDDNSNKNHDQAHMGMGDDGWKAEADDDRHRRHHMRHGAAVLSLMLRMLSRMDRLRSLTLDGFGPHVLPADSALQRLLGQHQQLGGTLRELHLRMICTADREITVSGLPHLTHLTLSFMGKSHTRAGTSWRSLTVQDLPSLKSVLLHDCVLPGRIAFHRVPELETLAFEGCDRLSDGRLLKVLSQFDNTLALRATQVAGIMQGQGQGSTAASSSLSSSSSSSSSQSSDTPGTVMKSPTTTEVLSTLKVRPIAELASRKLKKLVLKQCQPLSNPIIVVDTLEDLRINNCGSLCVPFIRCDGLKMLHIVYCPRLQNLLLGCDNLKHIDLHMSGRDDDNSSGSGSKDRAMSPRQAIKAALQQHYGKGNISINM